MCRGEGRRLALVANTATWHRMDRWQIGVRGGRLWPPSLSWRGSVRVSGDRGFFGCVVLFFIIGHITRARWLAAVVEPASVTWYKMDRLVCTGNTTNASQHKGCMGFNQRTFREEDVLIEEVKAGTATAFLASFSLVHHCWLEYLPRSASRALLPRLTF